MKNPPTLLLATRNAGKAKEIGEMLDPLGIRVVRLDQVPACVGLDVEETATTFRGNAMLKARTAALVSGLPTIADDSGLEVDVLEGAPGVYSARYAGVGGGDEANNAKLISKLAGVPREDRTARFRCALALFVPSAHGGDVLARMAEMAVSQSVESLGAEPVPAEDGVGFIWIGAVEGLIIDTPRGSGGFGYDPHFLIPDRGCTTAELPPDEKNAISHRGQAVRKLVAALEKASSWTEK